MPSLHPPAGIRVAVPTVLPANIARAIAPRFETDGIHGSHDHGAGSRFND